MAKFININDAELVKLTNKLEKLHRSAMPVAVRQTLNDAGFETRRGLIRTFKKNFIIRNRSFINAHAGVNKSANTFDINQMIVEAGIIAGKTKSGDLLEKQEKGGNILRKRIPSDSVRTNKSYKKIVLRRYYYSKFKNLKPRHLYRSGESTIIANKKGVYRIFRGGRIETLYTLNKIISIKAKPFLEPAANKAAKNLPVNFQKNAQKRFEKYLK